MDFPNQKVETVNNRQRAINEKIKEYNKKDWELQDLKPVPPQGRVYLIFERGEL